MNPKFERAVNSGDTTSVRLFLANELMLDPRGASFSEMLAFAEQRLSGSLYDADDGQTYTSDQSQWNEELLFKIKNDLDYNFSKERLRTYEQVAKLALKEKAARIDEEEARTSKQRNNRHQQTDSETETKDNPKASNASTMKWAAVGIAALAVLISLIIKKLKFWN